MRPLPTAAPTVANAWPRETWWGLCRCEIVARNSQVGQNRRRDNEYCERGRNQPEPMSARASSPHSFSSAAQLRRSPVTPTPPAGTSSHSTRTTGTLTLFAFRRQRAIADNEQDGSERTVSVPACLRAVQFAAVCSAPEAFNCRQIQPAAVRFSLPGWTSNPKAGGSNPPGRIELPANSSNLCVILGIESAKAHRVVPLPPAAQGAGGSCGSAACGSHESWLANPSAARESDVD